MTAIFVNGVITNSDDIKDIVSVSFNHLGNKVYAAQKIERMFGVFVSQPIEGDSGLISWNEVSWVAQKYEDTDVFVYIKSASTMAGLENSIWYGPYLNSTNDISDISGKYLQFMIVLANYGATTTNYGYVKVAATPVFSSISLTYLSNSNASLFYTKAFNLGFVPKHILLTYNGDVDANSVVRFAVSGFDSTNPDDYQYIDPNKIEELSELSILSNKIKLMIEMIGNTTVPIVIHEVALMFSGNQQLMVNDVSSSSESSTSSYQLVVLDDGDVYDVPLSIVTPIHVEFVGSDGSLATIILNEIYSYLVGNVSGSFVWDVGGVDEHTFTYIGETIYQLAGIISYTITWDGTGSLLFTLENQGEMSSSSDSSSSSYIEEWSSSSGSSSSSSYIEEWSSSSISSSSSSSSLDCPNSIYTLNSTLVIDKIFTSDNASIVCSIDGGLTKNSYMKLYTGDLSGVVCDPKILWGNVGYNNLVSSSFVSIDVNGTVYYIKLFTGNNSTDCCSNFVGSVENGSFVHAGYIPVNINSTDIKYISVYTKT